MLVRREIPRGGGPLASGEKPNDGAGSVARVGGAGPGPEPPRGDACEVKRSIAVAIGKCEAESVLASKTNWSVWGASWLGLFGCGSETCTLIGCPDELTITLVGSRTFEAGEYEIRVTADELDARCSFESSGAGGAGGEAPSSDGCDPPSTYIDRRANDVGDVVIVVRRAPETFTIAIEHDGQLLHEETLSPDYEFTTPNGPGCGECISSALDVELE